MQRLAFETRMVEWASKIEGLDADLLRQGLEISNLHRQVEARFEQDWSQWGLSAIQMRILMMLFHSKEIMTPALLAEEVSLSPSAMTSALDGLEKRDVLKRGPHAEDRRKVVVQLTTSGRVFVKERLPVLYRKICATTGCLSKHERDMFLRSYRKVLDQLQG
ncbi:MAG: MarR family winged helix-turn-helix transcriptional regulator [Roseovarius sp.]